MKPHIILLLAIGFLFSCSSKDKKPGEKNEPVAQASKPLLHYIDEGSGDKTLLFVHGWGINSTYWAKQIDFFKNKYRVIAVDLAGHGQSPANARETSADQLATGVDSVIKFLNLKNIILVGHSMSGDINLHVMNSNPETVIGFIGIDNLQEIGHQPTPQEEKEFTQFMDTLNKDYKGVAASYAKKYLFHPKTDSAVIKRVVNDIQSMDPVFSASIIRSLSVQYKTEQEIIPRMGIPLLLIISGDSLKNKTSLNKYCKGSYYYWTIADCGHYPMLEKPDELNNRLQEAIMFALKPPEQPTKK